MKFTPKTEKDINESRLLPAGIYDFKIADAVPKTSGPNSKNPGTPYIGLRMQVWSAEGAMRFVDGMLHPAMEAQLRHFCEVGGLMEHYEAGTLQAENCVGVAGKVKLRMREAEGNFGAKNEVQDFVVTQDKPAKAKPAPVKVAANEDDVPF